MITWRDSSSWSWGLAWMKGADFVNIEQGVIHAWDYLEFIHNSTAIQQKKNEISYIKGHSIQMPPPLRMLLPKKDNHYPYQLRAYKLPSQPSTHRLYHSSMTQHTYPRPLAHILNSPEQGHVPWRIPWVAAASASTPRLLVEKCTPGQLRSQ